MDPRIDEHARIIVDHSIDLHEGETVLIQAPSEAIDLVSALMNRIGERGAFPIMLTNDNRAYRSFIMAIDPDSYDGRPEGLVQLTKHADVAIEIRATNNVFEASDVPPEIMNAMHRIMKPIGDEITSKRWVTTQHPAPGNAQLAEMSTEAYADFVYGAINKDWDHQRAFQEHLVDLLSEAEEVRITAGDTTDLTMSIDGMFPINDFAERNLPGREVFVSPNPDTVEGEVLFDLPALVNGRELEGVYLTFESGEVVDYDAGRNLEVLETLLATDDGARRLGELGIGMNRSIDRFTYNILFDEKMGDTVHLALGNSVERSIGPDREGNESAIHLDMLVDMSRDSTITVDGTRIQRDGTFVFEEGWSDVSERPSARSTTPSS